MNYEDGVFEKFDEAVNDATQNDLDPTILFIATDGSRVYKAFTGPESAVGDYEPVFSQGFDEDVFIGVWSHAWLRDIIAGLEAGENPDDGWTELMEGMVLSIAEYADAKMPPATGNC